ncbi:MAG: hypothetical protein ACSLE1_09460 [Sphingobium sp.]
MSVRRGMAREARKRRLMALFAGSAAALAMLSVPIPLIELVVSSIGLSEAIPAAAPPLGFTARAVMAGFAGLLGTGVSLSLIPRSITGHQDKKEAGPPVNGESIMGFALSKLTSLARGRGRTKSDIDAADAVPVLRRADAHPDAPARRPIFASQDFDTEIFTRPAASLVQEPGGGISDKDVIDFSGVEVSSALDDLVESFEFAPLAAVEAEGLTMPHSPEPADDHALLVEAITALPEEADDAVQGNSEVAASLETLSVAELVDRFERGIQRRRMLAQAAAAARKIDEVLVETGKPPVTEARVLADIPPAPRVDVREGVDAEVDEALRTALGTLHKMTSR